MLTLAVIFTGLYNGQFAPGVAGGILGGLLMIASLLVLLYFQRKSLAVSRTKSVSRRTALWIVNLIGAVICTVAFGMEFGSAVVGGVYLISMVVAEFCTVMMESARSECRDPG